MESENFEIGVELPEGQTIDEVCSIPENNSGVKLKDVIRTTFFVGVISMLLVLACLV